MAYTPTNNPYIPGDPYSYDLKWMVEEVKKAQAVGEEAAESAEAAAASAEAASDSAYNAATSASNALIFSQNAEASAENAADSAENAADSAENAAGMIAPITQALNSQGQQISVLEGRMDTFASLTQGSTTGDAELQDIRVGADGTVYPTAGDAVRGQSSNLLDDIIKVSNGYAFFDASEFVRGQIEGGVDGTYYQNRIKLSTMHNTGDYPKKFRVMDADYSVDFEIYDENETWAYSTGYINSYIIDKDTNYRLVIKKNADVDADHNTPANIPLVATKLGYESLISHNVDLAYKGKLKTTLLDYPMEMGTLDADGNNSEHAYNKTRKMRTTGFVFVKKGDVLKSNDSELRFMVFYFGMNKKFKSQTSWITTSLEFTENQYVRIQFALNDDTQLQDKWKANYRNALIIENNLSDVIADIDSNINELQGAGKQYSYDGEKIDVNKYTYDITPLWNFENPTTSGSFSKQASAYNNGVVFKCLNPDLMQLYELETGSKIAEFSITSGHGNSIDFSSEYYDSSDEFPLAYISSDGTPANVYVNRITRTGATLVRTLTFPSVTTGYYANHCLDNVNNVLYMMGYKNEDYQTALNGNHMIVTKWDLSALTDNGNNTYTPAFIDTFDLPFIDTTQGRAFLNGKMFIVSSNPYVPTDGKQTKVYVVDVGGQRISNILSSFIERIIDHECEGIFFAPNGNKYDMIIDVQSYGLYELNL